MITSTQNPLIKRCRKLSRQKKVRLAERAGFVEGLRPVLTAVEHTPQLIEAVLVAPTMLQSEQAWGLLEESEVRVEAVSDPLFLSISGRENPTGLAAIIRSPAGRLADFAIDRRGLYLLLERISDPGNLGTILRSADAAGASGIILFGGGVDLTHPTAIKASMGALFTLPIAELSDLGSLSNWCLAHNIFRVATSTHGTKIIWELDFDPHQPALVLMGNEQFGLTAELRESADVLVRIPMWGQATSLNVGTAATLLLYELKRRRWVDEQPSS